MFKTLMRKQLEELLSPVLIDRKKNQKRSKDRAILFGLLFAFCFVALASAFVGLSFLMALAVLHPGRDRYSGAGDLRQHLCHLFDAVSGEGQ